MIFWKITTGVLVLAVSVLFYYVISLKAAVVSLMDFSRTVIGLFEKAFGIEVKGGG